LIKNLVLAGLIFLALLVAGCNNGTSATGVGGEASGNLENGVRIIIAKAFKYDFDPNPIIVNQGERVKIIMTSQDVTHGFALPDYNINVPLPRGKPTIIEFVADRQGTFPFICSVFCGSGHNSMSGRLIVK